MALDANIPLQVRQIDTSNPLAGLVQMRGAQEQQAYARGMEQQQMQRQAMLDKQNAQMQQAQMGHLEQQDKLVQAQLARAQFDQMNDKERENYKRVVAKAMRIKPLVDAGQFDSAYKLAEAFQRDNYDRMAKGEDTHSEDTDFFVDLLKNQKYDEAKMVLDGVIQSNALLGGVNVKTSGGIAKSDAPSGYRYKNDGSLEPIPGGPQDAKSEQAEQKRTGALNEQISKAAVITGKVDEALKQLGSAPNTKVLGLNIPVGLSQTGAVGQIARNIGGTDAYNLNSTVDTIKANLGFEELQKMRNNSPTGGALGQVAVRELDLLQSTIASLDTAQSEDQLKKNLEQVKTHYSNWLNAVNQSQGGQQDQGWAQTPSGTKYRVVKQ